MEKCTREQRIRQISLKQIEKIREETKIEENKRKKKYKTIQNNIKQNKTQ